MKKLLISTCGEVPSVPGLQSHATGRFCRFSIHTDLWICSPQIGDCLWHSWAYALWHFRIVLRLGLKMLLITRNKLSTRNPEKFSSGPQAIGKVHKFLFWLFSSGSDELQHAAGSLLALSRCKGPHMYLEGGGDVTSMWKDIPASDTVLGFGMGAKFLIIASLVRQRPELRTASLRVWCLGSAFLLLPPQCMEPAHMEMNVSVPRFS